MRTRCSDRIRRGSARGADQCRGHIAQGRRLSISLCATILTMVPGNDCGFDAGAGDWHTAMGDMMSGALADRTNWLVSCARRGKQSVVQAGRCSSQVKGPRGLKEGGKRRMMPGQIQC